MTCLEESRQIVESSVDTCDQLRASAVDARRRAALSRRVVEESRQLRAKVASQELRVMGVEQEALLTGHADHDPHQHT